jgi:hypothetical protein
MLSNSTHLALAERLAHAFSVYPCVEAIALGGSVATAESIDPASDIDLYVFGTDVIPLAERQMVVDRVGAARADLNLRFWDLGDAWYDRDTGIEVDVIYWDTGWISGQIERVLTAHQASLGYTTCFCHTLRHCRIFFDRAGWLGALVERCQSPYPEALRRNIVRLNHAVLRSVIPCYLHQIEKAAQRQDRVSLNHRTAALLASYFDILFALNRLLHPGEKRLLQIASERCLLRPPDMIVQVEAVLAAAPSTDARITTAVTSLLDGLDDLLCAEGFITPPVASPKPG